MKSTAFPILMILLFLVAFSNPNNTRTLEQRTQDSIDYYQKETLINYQNLKQVKHEKKQILPAEGVGRR